MSCKAAMKQFKHMQTTELHLNRPRSLEHEQCKYKIFRYELRPKLPFTLERRAGFCFGYDQGRSPIILENAQKRGNRDVWRLALVWSQAQEREAYSSARSWEIRASIPQVSVPPVPSTKEATSNRYVYGATLDQIVKEEIPGSAPIVKVLPTTTNTPIRSWGVAVRKPANRAAAQSIAAVTPEPLGLSDRFGKSKKG
ncbi:hypothetical protein HOY82DRAFT_604846 [Tuber indicum]|nr:hypothetical protein HOY82DRAFT_604846 [Tuber indicum]